MPVADRVSAGNKGKNHKIIHHNTHNTIVNPQSIATITKMEDRRGGGDRERYTTGRLPFVLLLFLSASLSISLSFSHAKSSTRAEND